MINVASYWTLPPSRQRKIRAKVEKEEQELQRIVGHYVILGEVFQEETSEVCIEFSFFCTRCFNVPNRVLYMPLTKEEYLDKNHDMYGEKCEKCNKPLA